MDQLSTRTLQIATVCFGVFGAMWLLVSLGSWGMFVLGLPAVGLAAYLGREVMRRRALEEDDSDARFAKVLDPVEAMSPVTRETLTEVAEAAFELARSETSRVVIDIDPLRDASGAWRGRHTISFEQGAGTGVETSARLTAAVEVVVREMQRRGTPVRMRVTATKLEDGQLRVNARFDAGPSAS